MKKAPLKTAPKKATKPSNKMKPKILLDIEVGKKPTKVKRFKLGSFAKVGAGCMHTKLIDNIVMVGKKTNIMDNYDVITPRGGIFGVRAINLEPTKFGFKTKKATETLQAMYFDKPPKPTTYPRLLQKLITPSGYVERMMNEDKQQWLRVKGNNHEIMMTTETMKSKASLSKNAKQMLAILQHAVKKGGL